MLTEETRVALKEIVADESFNSRKRYDGIEDLAESIKRDGQLYPVDAIKRDGKLFLVAGFRRFKALKLLGSDTIKVCSREGIENEGAAKVLNLVENVARKQLTPYEIAKACKDLADKYKMSGSEIGKHLVQSKSHVNNLIGALENLIPGWLELWEAGHEKATTQHLFKLKALTPEEQEAKLREALGQEDETEEMDAENEGEEKGKPGKKRPSKSHLDNAKSIVSKFEGLDPTAQAACLATLRWALGDVLTLKIDGTVVYDPRKPAKEAKEDEEGDSAEE